MLTALKLLESLLLNHVIPRIETNRLIFNLPGLMKLTTINFTDSEKDARKKIELSNSIMKDRKIVLQIRS